jgi:hypothetical protein
MLRLSLSLFPGAAARIARPARYLPHYAAVFSYVNRAIVTLLVAAHFA